ncbi:MAG TPA: extracellular solute-binding protein, partial [Mycobacteriales bacterium]|nr:extracellular solute-binding protein [Mycobacteriales bacterium]
MNGYRTSVRHALRGVALGVLPLLLAAACGGSGGGSGHPSAQGCHPSGGKVSLTFWSWEPGIDKIVDVWNKQNPNIQVKVKEVVSGAMGTYQNYNNAIKAHTTPDIGMIEYDSLGSYRLQNALANLASCPGVAKAQSAFVPWTWSQGTFGQANAVYAVPQDTGPMAMYYRKDIFSRYHIPVPSTWDQYYQDAKLLKAADPAASMMHIGQDAAWFEGLLWQDGARPFDTNGNKVTVSLTGTAEKQVT